MLLQICFFDSFLNFFTFRKYRILNYVLDERDCNFHLNSTSGTITSPGYPAKYGNDLNCTTIITVAKEQRVHLYFTIFSLEDPTVSENGTYCDDYVELIDRFSSKKYCGTAIPPLMMSEANQLTIRFISDYVVTRQGFSATYSAVSCKYKTVSFSFIYSIHSI